MNRLWRLLIHVPVGVVNGLIFNVNVFAGVVFAWGFIHGYEFNEDSYIQDQAWKDICGYLWGFALWFVVHQIIIWGR